MHTTKRCRPPCMCRRRKTTRRTQCCFTREHNSSTNTLCRKIAKLGLSIGLSDNKPKDTHFQRTQGSEIRRRPPSNLVSREGRLLAAASQRQNQHKEGIKSIRTRRKLDVHAVCQCIQASTTYTPRPTCHFRSLRSARSPSPVGRRPETRCTAGEWAGAGKGRHQISKRLHPPYSEHECKVQNRLAQPRPSLLSSGSDTQAGRLYLHIFLPMLPVASRLSCLTCVLAVYMPGLPSILPGHPSNPRRSRAPRTWRARAWAPA